jgi:hypothetical protein
MEREHLSHTIPRDDLVRRTWKRLRLAHGAKPIAAALIIGGATLVIAAELGATELALAAISAYVTYRMLRYGIDLKQALTETIELERAAEIP